MMHIRWFFHLPIFLKRNELEMEPEKQQPSTQNDAVADAKGKLLFAAIVFGSMLFCKFVLGW